MKRCLPLLVIALTLLVLPALADKVAALDIPVYQVVNETGDVYTSGQIVKGDVYTILGECTPPQGTPLADFFIASTPITWGQVEYDYLNNDGKKTGLIVLNPGVIIGKRQYTETEAAQAEERAIAFGNRYEFSAPSCRVHPNDELLVLCESLSLREAPASSAAVKASLPYGTVLQATSDTHPGWLGVRCGDITGWAREEYLLVSPDYLSLTAETPVYAAPAPDAPRVALLDPGTRCPIISQWDDDVVISLRGASRWIKK